ncbi:YfbM family protein [Streptomycetaceae bacterium NBC_01309]
MSMWLTLAKIDPALLPDVRSNPDLLDDLLNGDHPEDETHGEDYRTIDHIAEGRAEVEEGAADWREAYPWLGRATGHGSEEIEGDDFGYGPAFVLTPDEVRQVAEGLVGEGWSRFLELAPFLTRAAAEGKAVVGAVI